MNTTMTVLQTISMITSLGAGTFAPVAARNQPDKARQLRVQSVFMFGLATVMAILLFL